MLFLFNDAVFDIGDPHETVFSLGTERGFSEAKLVTMRLGTIFKMVRTAVFDAPQVARTNPDLAAFIAALIAWKSGEANALLAVAPRHAVAFSEVQIRLASVSLITMTQLRELQDLGKLSSHTANLSVWAHAPQRMKA